MEYFFPFGAAQTAQIVFQQGYDLVHIKLDFGNLFGRNIFVGHGLLHGNLQFFHVAPSLSILHITQGKNKNQVSIETKCSL